MQTFFELSCSCESQQQQNSSCIWWYASCLFTSCACTPQYNCVNSCESHWKHLGSIAFWIPLQNGNSDQSPMAKSYWTFTLVEYAFRWHEQPYTVANTTEPVQVAYLSPEAVVARCSLEQIKQNKGQEGGRERNGEGAAGETEKKWGQGGGWTGPQKRGGLATVVPTKS